MWTGIVLVCCLSLAVASALLQKRICCAATGSGAVRDFRQFTAEQLDRDVRGRVPLGSPRTFVEGFLNGEGMRFSYDPSQQAILAVAPCVKGSGIVLKSLGFSFKFDSDSRLKSIDSKVHLTGP